LQRQDEEQGKYYAGCSNEKQRRMFDQFHNGAYSSDFYLKLEIPPLKRFVGEWFEEGDYGFIHASRGVGKTLFCLWLARALAYGKSFGEWKVKQPVKLLYVDGEMSPCEMQGRMKAMEIDSSNFGFINHEMFFRANESVFNLADKDCQGALTWFCKSEGFKVVVLDNLSALFPGVEENSADAWEPVLAWFLQLRRAGISVILVHHSGKEGKQRGTSRREDHAAWCINLKAVESHQGAKFTSEFTKSRHCALPKELEWSFLQNNEQMTVGFKTNSVLDQIYQLIVDGVHHNKDISEHLGVSNADVTRKVNILIQRGLVYKNGKEYLAGRPGFEKKDGANETSLPPIQDAILSVVRSWPEKSGRPEILMAELKEEVQKVGKWGEDQIQRTLKWAVEEGFVKETEVENPKKGRGQKKTTRAFSASPEANI
jgi:predicted transcriptional regulator